MQVFQCVGIDGPHDSGPLAASRTSIGPYTQCIIPVMYIVYMAALQHLPNRVFYPGTRNVEDADLFANRMLVIGMQGVFQLSLLLVLHRIVASRFAVSTLYQIAFVLETQTLLVHGKLSAWLIFSVGFQLEHYGKAMNAVDWRESTAS
ncbi:hypothetical protein PHYSODRAFT_331957 [Phytophthora sojae]|uniref:Uncharacterized protein n=1 Tax=Phytophthora sojae (strain P6497) TaxID=1094619 RepID=G4ZI49_PHYSP|nr:hypothetical protein PHYSODRAFT_331957 [Phytophthora sojae]EGZ18098.1 hypothetical protein PHYSODRAFT_331957 [Phytophthora sojae]|eukprot:XP_009527156.1 hypothetical protein PHYSODRAFT_331957 [Phytophthora sojae]